VIGFRFATGEKMSWIRAVTNCRTNSAARIFWRWLSARGIFSLALLALAIGAGSRAAAETIPAADFMQPPTAKRLSALMAAAQSEGWAAQSGPLRAAAQAAYQHDKLTVADEWFSLYRWSMLFSLDEAAYVPTWKKALAAAGVDHAAMPKVVPTRHLQLGARLLPELQLWILSNPAFSQEFFSLLTPVDYLPNVLQIFSELHFRDPELFKTYSSLAIAIALVYDVAPPPYWPHGQVSASALPRTLPRPVDAFFWWTKQDREGRTYHRLTELGADELKFVVDAAAPFIELEWSQQISGYSLKSLDRAYTMVRYDSGRVQRNEFQWDGQPYTLDAILAAGGICTEQAYFACEVGKARGVPTLLFRGQGTDSRHAWFGFLDGKQKWQLDAGRYGEQRFVTGYALDPQTWRNITDHELRFLSERFRTRPSYQRSRVHTEFAADFFANGDPAAAEVAARKAIAEEKRNHVPWQILFAVDQKLGRDAAHREATLREAAAAFHSYPELEGFYLGRVVESLRARGENAAADAEQNRLLQKDPSGRADIKVQEARLAIVRTFTTQPIAEQIRTFDTIVTTYGRGAGITFFDQVVVVFVEHLWQLQQPAEAAKAVALARATLKVGGNSQLARDFDKLSQLIKTGPP
jgi:hypothetical protein